MKTPNCLLINPNISLKAYKTAILLVFFPVILSAQSLTGLWTGAVYNDSTTVRKEQLFEIALTEYKGKVYGYSRSEFIVNDTLYYIVKRVKGTITGDVCEVKDEEIVAYNFRGKLDKGVKVTSTFLRNKQDSTWYLAGSWKTNSTKKFYSLSGKISLAEEKDLSASKIFPHLEELNRTKDLSFYNERKKTPPVMKNVEPDHIRLASLIKAEKQTPIPANSEVLPGANEVEINTVDVSSSKTIRTNATTAKTNTVELPKTDVALTKAEIKNESFNVKKIEPEPREEPLKTTIARDQQKTIDKPVAKAKLPDNKPAEIKTAPVTKAVITPATKTEVKKSDALGVQTKTEAAIVKTAPAEPIIKSASSLVIPETVAGRKSEYAQTVLFRSDSLLLSLYDNGEIDGDTVSVFMNGAVILSKQGLKASAIKKTIYLPPGGTDEFSLVLYADNLGKYPPNTGLLVVHDGDDVYNIRFSADFQKNAGVVFRRK